VTNQCIQGRTAQQGYGTNCATSKVIVANEQHSYTQPIDKMLTAKLGCMTPSPNREVATENTLIQSLSRAIRLAGKEDTAVDEDDVFGRLIAMEIRKIDDSVVKMNTKQTIYNCLINAKMSLLRPAATTPAKEQWETPTQSSPPASTSWQQSTPRSWHSSNVSSVNQYKQPSYESTQSHTLQWSTNAPGESYLQLLDQSWEQPSYSARYECL
jgi:hypothetical protein